MALSIKHTTSADATFSPAGAAAWDAEHAVVGIIATSNIISSPSTIEADTSYIVVEELSVTADLQINGYLGVL